MARLGDPGVRVYRELDPNDAERVREFLVTTELIGVYARCPALEYAADAKALPPRRCTLAALHRGDHVSEGVVTITWPDEVDQ